jgi:hypothetical protein
MATRWQPDWLTSWIQGPEYKAQLRVYNPLTSWIPKALNTKRRSIPSKTYRGFTCQKTSINTGKVTSGDLFGLREYLKNNYLYRFAAAALGI